jgi:membrane protease YdiL (CAAX protease family)
MPIQDEERNVSEAPTDGPGQGSEAIKENLDQPPPLPAAPPSPIHQVFLGPNGIRAGWRLLIFLGCLFFLFLLAAVIIGVFVPVSRLVPQEIAEAPRMLLEAASEFVLVALAVFMTSKIEGRPMRAYGLPVQGAFGRNFWLGALTGFSMLAVLLIVIFALGDFSFGRIVLSAPDIVRYGLLWGASFLMVGFFEEYLFRGYPLFTLTTGIGFWPAAILLSLLFAALHRGNDNENWLGLLEIVPIAIFFCLTLRHTGSLWFAIGYHAAWDWGLSYFYGIPDSGVMVRGHLLNASLHGPAWITGGGAGPEGSVLLLPLTVLLIWLFHRAYPTSNYPDPEMVGQWRRLRG